MSKNDVTPGRCGSKNASGNLEGARYRGRVSGVALEAKHLPGPLRDLIRIEVRDAALAGRDELLV